MSTKTSVMTVMPPAPARTAAVAKRAPTEDEIAVRAYELFLQEGAANGRDMEHWLRAEEELKSRKKS